ncbi:MAG: condensation domain-containing protein, partial [Actinomycetia bacterium]|nr:condensation domain-containing protein [Actinomycetes bacterium]
LEGAALRAELAGALPGHLVPSAVVVLEDLPLTVGGKLDRKALPAPGPAAGAASRSPRGPRSSREEVLCGLFAEVLGVPEVGIDDGFFDLGGDSIVSIQLVSKAREAGLVITPRDVFAHQSVTALAAAAREMTPADAAGAPEDGAGPAELTPVMREFELGGPGFASFHQAALVQVPAGTGLEELRGAWQALLDHHDALRGRLAGSAAAGWSLDIPVPGSVPARSCVRRVSVTGLSGGELVAAEAEAARQAERELDPVRGEMTRLVWFDAGPRKPGRLLVMVHHLVVDGVSWRILLPDLKTAWETVTAGGSPALASAGTSFRRWTRLLEAEANDPRRTAELPGWEKTAERGDPLPGTRTLDPERDTLGSASSLTLTVPAEETGPLLTRLPALYHCGAEDVLLTGLALAFRRWRRDRGPAGGGPLLMDVEGHGREEIIGETDLSRTVGWFTSMHPVRLTLDGVDEAEALAGQGAAGTALRHVKEQLREMPDHGIGYGLLRYLNPETGPRLARRPRPRIVFNYLGRFPAPGGADWAPAAEADLVADANQESPAPLTHPLTITAVAREHPGGPELHLSFLWPPDLLPEAGVRELAETWRQALGALAAHAGEPGAGGWSPSDFPLVALSQGEIDELAVSPQPVRDVLPLAPLQEGLLFHALMAEGDRDVYVVQLVLELEGEVNPGRLRAAAGALVERHRNLAARFVVRGSGDAVQVIPERADVPWRETAAAGDTELEAIAAQERNREFDVSRPPLLRFALVALGNSRQALVVTAHHILLDGWSMPVMVRELFALYASGGDERALSAPVPFREYLRWLAARDRPAAETAWRAYLAGLEGPCRVAPEVPAASGAPERLSRTVPAGLSGRLSRRARELGVTLGTMVQGAWAVVLGCLTGRDDVVFGWTVSGRPPELAGVESMVGLFINTVPVRVRLDRGESVRELLRRVQAEQTDLLEHQFLGLADIQRLAGGGELFDTTAVLENYPLDPGDFAGDIGGVRLVGSRGQDAAHYPLSLAVVPGRELVLRLGHRPDAVPERTADAVASRLVRVLGAVAADPGVRVG